MVFPKNRSFLMLISGLIIAEIQDPTRLPTYSSKNTNILPLVGHLIDASVEE
jgi:hypothetical protein